MLNLIVLKNVVWLLRSGLRVWYKKVARLNYSSNLATFKAFSQLSNLSINIIGLGNFISLFIGFLPNLFFLSIKIFINSSSVYPSLK